MNVQTTRMDELIRQFADDFDHDENHQQAERLSPEGEYVWVSEDDTMALCKSSVEKFDTGIEFSELCKEPDDMDVTTHNGDTLYIVTAGDAEHVYDSEKLDYFADLFKAAVWDIIKVNPDEDDGLCRLTDPDTGLQAIVAPRLTPDL